MTDNTIKVELLSDKALALLLQLEQLNILRLVRSGDMEEKPKRQWAGSISKETASELLISRLPKAGRMGNAHIDLESMDCH
ncbi:MAG: hypothetical protein IPK21_22640 [Haliscomenobacter sp.]|nr:hypothetical protein [Haliscomenobacter sp.]